MFSPNRSEKPVNVVRRRTRQISLGNFSFLQNAIERRNRSVTKKLEPTQTNTFISEYQTFENCINTTKITKSEIERRYTEIFGAERRIERNRSMEIKDEIRNEIGIYQPRGMSMALALSLPCSRLEILYKRFFINLLKCLFKELKKFRSKTPPVRFSSLTEKHRNFEKFSSKGIEIIRKILSLKINKEFKAFFDCRKTKKEVLKKRPSLLKKFVLRSSLGSFQAELIKTLAWAFNKIKSTEYAVTSRENEPVLLTLRSKHFHFESFTSMPNSVWFSEQMTPQTTRRTYTQEPTTARRYGERVLETFENFDIKKVDEEKTLKVSYLVKLLSCAVKIRRSFGFR